MHGHLEALNFARDTRNCDPARIPTIQAEQADGSFLEVSLPYVWKVCPVCDGKGTHVDPAIDCGGITAEEMDDDPDFRDDYMAGVYEQTCNRCQGRTTVPTVDHARLTPELRAAWERLERDQRAYQEECIAELRAAR